jgi:hypothetical protein
MIEKFYFIFCDAIDYSCKNCYEITSKMSIFSHKSSLHMEADEEFYRTDCLPSVETS